MPIPYPYKFSDWYGYSKNCIPTPSYFSYTVSSSSATSTTLACDLTPDTTVYSSDSPLEANSVIYTDTALTSVFIGDSGHYSFIKDVGKESWVVTTSGVLTGFGTLCQTGGGGGGGTPTYYTHTVSTSISTSGVGACALTTTPTTVYTTAENLSPGMIIYTDTGLSIPFNGGNRWRKFNHNQPNEIAFEVSSSGVLGSTPEYCGFAPI